jgi:hypothetical protein
MACAKCGQKVARGPVVRRQGSSPRKRSQEAVIAYSEFSHGGRQAYVAPTDG